MFTNITASYNNGDVLIEAACLSTDTKPTDGIANGSACIEMDTGDKYMFDEAGGQWIKLGSGGGGDTGEVWLVGDTGVEQGGMMTFALSNVDATDHITELFTNAENYKLFLNGEELPYFQDMSSDSDVKEYLWSDKQYDSQPTKRLMLVRQPSTSDMAVVAYTDPSTAPTSVEVSVKAK